MGIRFIGSMDGGICRWRGWILRSMGAQGHRSGLLCGGIGGCRLLNEKVLFQVCLFRVLVGLSTYEIMQVMGFRN